MVLLDDAVRLPIAAKMKERALSAILANMPPAEAKKLTESLAKRFSAAQMLAQNGIAQADPATPAPASASPKPAKAAASAPAKKPAASARQGRKARPRKRAPAAAQASAGKPETAAPAPAAGPAAAQPPTAG